MTLSSLVFRTVSISIFGLFTHMVRADLIAYWPLDDGPAGSAATIADEVINAGLTFTDATPVGSGQTWVFDATRNRIVLSTLEQSRFTAGTQGIDRTQGFTWSLWANVSSSNLSDSGADVIMGTRSSTGGFWNKIDVGGQSNWSGIAYPNTTFADDQWHHIVYQGDLTSVRMYKDGVLIGQDTTTPTLTYNGALQFGGANSFSEDITGRLSDIAIWNEALPLSRIQELAAGGPVLNNNVPEPTSFILLGLGALALFRRRYLR